MALDTNNEIINGNGGIVVKGTAVSGGYFVTNSIDVTATGETGKIPDYACVEGALCYCTGDSQFYQYHKPEGADKGEWAVKVFAASTHSLDKDDVTKVMSDLGLVSTQSQD
jgi:hypothetical protein